MINTVRRLNGDKDYDVVEPEDDDGQAIEHIAQNAEKIAPCAQGHFYNPTDSYNPLPVIRHPFSASDIQNAGSPASPSNFSPTLSLQLFKSGSAKKRLSGAFRASRVKKQPSRSSMPISSIKKVMIFAGEASGDLQGAMLAREMRKINPDIEFSGVGGVRMKEEGVNLYFDSTTFGVIGPWEGVKMLPTLLGLYNRCKKEFVKTRPDLAVLIDTPAFNMRLAKLSRKEGIKTVYYFPPSAWSGSEKRAREIAASVDSVITIFKFTADTYDRAGAKHYFAGHPLIDVIKKWKDMPRNELLQRLGLEEGPTYIAFMPGSRSQEITHVLPLLVDAASQLKKEFAGVHFLAPVASPLLKEAIEAKLKDVDFPITIYDGRSQEIMAVSRLAIMASGSASLEASILETPMILTYRLNEFDYKIIRFFIKQRWAGLPNLILQRDVAPELLQEEATVENICAWAKDLIPDGEKRQKMLSDLKELNESMGKPGVVKRVVEHIDRDVLG